MLGDNPEKSKNPLKKAMRRRNAKTVQFSAPTYVEASDVEYSSEEEEEAEGEYFGQGQEEEEVRDEQGQELEPNLDDSTTVEPPRSTTQPAIDPQAAIDPRVDAPTQNTQNNVADKSPAEDVIEQNGKHTVNSSHDYAHLYRRRSFCEVKKGHRTGYGLILQG